MSIYEIIGTVFGLLCVILTVRQSIWSWPTGIISVLAFMLLFFQIKLYADMGLQAFYIITGFYGWYLWLYGGKNQTKLQISTLSNRARILFFLVLIPTIYLMGYFLKTYTDASLPFWDSIASTLSIFAQILLMKKWLENWVLWVLVDILSIGIYFYKGVYLTAGLYVVFLFLAITGFVTWYKIWKKQQQDSSLENSPHSIAVMNS